MNIWDFLCIGFLLIVNACSVWYQLSAYRRYNHPWHWYSAILSGLLIVLLIIAFMWRWTHPVAETSMIYKVAPTNAQTELTSLVYRRAGERDSLANWGIVDHRVQSTVYSPF